MKGKIIDYNYFEAFVALEDDTIVKVPLTQVNDYLGIGYVVNIDSNNLSHNTSNQPKMHQDKVIDFF